ncbi:MAG: putative peptide transporter, peptide-binding protein [Rhizobacter sp.]|nr:putative peptide transporter, peptide-binding protein [Rhizobacter sp.]
MILKRTFIQLAAASALALLGGMAMAQDAKVLRVVPQSDLKVLDPIWTTAYITRNYGYMVYDTLFAYDEAGKVQPQMVDKYTVSKDLKVWEFTLRPGLAFGDGKPVTSDDVVASIARWGKRDVFGQRLVGAIEKTEVVSPTTFRYTFKQPFGLTIDAFAKPGTNVAFIMPKSVAETPADKQIDDNTGSGPFMLKKDEYRPGEKVVFVKNPYYKPRSEPASGLAGGKKVNFDRVEWVILKDAQTQANALTNGEVDMLEVVPAEHYASLRTNPKIELEQVIPANVFVGVYNHLVPPFDNPKIAKAALMAINQEALLRGQVLFRDLYKPCVSIYACSSPYASTQAGYFTGKPQFEEAKKLLKEAGYDGKPVVLMAPTDITAIAKLPQVYAQLLKQAGFNVDMQSMDWGTLQARRAKKDPADKGGWNVFITAWGGPDATNPVLYGSLTGNGEKGFFGWPTDTKLESLKGEFMGTTDEAKRKQYAQEMQDRSFENGIIGPMGEAIGMTAMRKGEITGVLKAPALVFWNLQKKAAS